MGEIEKKIAEDEASARRWLVAGVAIVIIGVAACVAGAPTSEDRFNQIRGYVSVPAMVLKKVPDPDPYNKRHTYLLSVETPTYGIISIQPLAGFDTGTKRQQEAIDSLVEGDCILINLPDAGVLTTQRYLR